jgi:hypothetical protein
MHESASIAANGPNRGKPADKSAFRYDGSSFQPSDSTAADHRVAQLSPYPAQFPAQSD